jgi:hypothetical protein
MERSPDDLLVERSLDDELPDDEYVRTHGTEIKEPPYEDFTNKNPNEVPHDPFIARRFPKEKIRPLTEEERVGINRALGYPDDHPQPHPDDHCKKCADDSD